MKKLSFDKIFNLLNYIFMIFIILIMVYPMYFTIIASISEPVDVATGKVVLLPSGITWDAYKNVFQNKEVWRGYKNTVFYTLAGTGFSLFLTIPAAYALSKKKLHGRKFLMWYFIIVMFFTGGLIPTYITLRNLDLLNKFYTLVAIFAFSEFYLIITRIFYQTTIPDEIYEAAHIDGCNDFGQFFRIALPLSPAIIAVMALFYGVAKWNDYMTALFFVSNSKYYPLQLILRTILIENQSALAGVSVRSMKGEELLNITRRAYMAEAMKYALIFIASAPLLIAYPFVQKHFVKGMLIGSLKG